MKTQLTKEDWLLIAQDYGRNGVGATELAKKIGVSKQRIFQVVDMLRAEFKIDIPYIRGSKGLKAQYAEFVKKNLSNK